MIFAGVDVGSISTKVALLDETRLLGVRVSFTGYNASTAAKRVLEELLAQQGIEAGNVASIVATGYGRGAVNFADKAITEITCHAAGAHFLDPQGRFVIDIGGQDSKAIELDATGRVKNFLMNDKCAAGTGRFLEVMARALELDLESFAEFSLRADNPATISNICTVFAESEVISLIASGEKRENIIAGIHQAIATRVLAMSNRLARPSKVTMTGGVAKNAGLVKALSNKLGVPVKVSAYPQENGAIGAAVLARQLRAQQ
ncbi:MAG: acyl-CoA dehydratase activase [Deltaproteobacteria bacterium]|nr:acyl-CoA dehydratase activase [Deltaproteobacteria bacterium]